MWNYARSTRKRVLTKKWKQSIFLFPKKVLSLVQFGHISALSRSLHLAYAWMEIESPAWVGRRDFRVCCLWQADVAADKTRDLVVSLCPMRLQKALWKIQSLQTGNLSWGVGNATREKGDCLSCQYRAVCWGSFRTSVSTILTFSWTHSEHR